MSKIAFPWTITDGAAKSLRNAIDGLKVKPTQPSVDPTEPPTQPPTNPSYVKYGDVNLDFEVGIIDATYIQRAVAQLDVLYNEQIVNADVDGDNEVSIASMMQYKGNHSDAELIMITHSVKEGQFMLAKEEFLNTAEVYGIENIIRVEEK